MDTNRAEADAGIDALAVRFRDGDAESVRELYRLTGRAAYAVSGRAGEGGAFPSPPRLRGGEGRLLHAFLAGGIGTMVIAVG